MIKTILVSLLALALADEYDEQLEKEWAATMKDFLPNDYMTVALQKNDDIELFAQITHETNIRAAFFTEMDSSVSVGVFAPTGRMLNLKKEKQQGIISFKAAGPGLYKFRLESKNPCRATLAIQLPVEENFDDIHQELLLKNPGWADAWFENKQNDDV